jgi:hypothetical protein
MKTIAVVLIATSVGMGAAQGPAPSPAGPREFEEASIRPCDPNALPPTPDGARGGGANTFQLTPGRTHVQCMTVATIIRTAYDFTLSDPFFFRGNHGFEGAGLTLEQELGLKLEPASAVREFLVIDSVERPSAN